MNCCLKLRGKLLCLSITYLSTLCIIALADSNSSSIISVSTNSSSSSSSSSHSSNGTSDTNSEETCLLRSLCKNTVNGVTRNSPCDYGKFAPFNNVTDDDFYDLLWTHCPHFFDDKGELAHPICCSAEQEDSIAKLVNQVEIIRRTCPSCTVNAKKYFCNLFCMPNQAQIVNVEQTLKNHAAVNVTYVISEQFARTFFDSCYDVKIFGAYLMDQSYICGAHKREKCDPQTFLATLGSIAQMPLIVTPLITANMTVTLSGRQFAPMIDKVYRCDEAPPDETKCSCDQCSKRCNETIGGLKTPRQMSFDTTPADKKGSKNNDNSAKGGSNFVRHELYVGILVTVITISHYFSLF